MISNGVGPFAPRPGHRAKRSTGLGPAHRRLASGGRCWPMSLYVGRLPRGVRTRRIHRTEGRCPSARRGTAAGVTTPSRRNTLRHGLASAVKQSSGSEGCRDAGKSARGVQQRPSLWSKRFGWRNQSEFAMTCHPRRDLALRYGQDSGQLLSYRIKLGGHRLSRHVILVAHSLLQSSSIVYPCSSSA